MPFIELAAVVVCSTCAGFFVGRSLFDTPSPPDQQVSSVGAAWIDAGAWPPADGLDGH